MVDAEVTINDQTEGASTKNVDTESLTVGAKTVQRQRIQVAGATDTAIASVTSSAPTTEFGLVTRNIPSGTQAISNANLDAAISTRATEATLALIKAKTDNLDVALSTLEISEVTNAGTFAVQDSEKLADNAGFTDGTTKVIPTGQIYDEVAGTALTENDIAASRIDAKRASICTIEDETTRGRRTTVTAANALKVDGSAVTQPVSIAATVATDPTDDPTRDNGKIDIAAFDVALPTGDNNIGNVDIVTMPEVTQDTATALKSEVVGPTADNAVNPTAKVTTLPVVANAAAPTYTEARVNPLSTDLSGRLRTDTSTWLGSTAPSIGSKTSANSIPVVIASDQGNVAVSQATASSLNAQAVGNSADAAGDSGNPIKIGIIGRTTNRTAVTDGQRVNVTGDDLGRQVIVLNQVRDLVNDQTTTIAASTAETTIFTAVASVFNDLVLITIANTSATATRVDIRDTTAGSVRFSLYCPAGATVGFVPVVPLKQATVNTNWTATCITSLTDLRIFVQVVRNV